jgi:hypothetical protein
MVSEHDLQGPQDWKTVLQKGIRLSRQFGEIFLGRLQRLAVLDDFLARLGEQLPKRTALYAVCWRWHRTRMDVERSHRGAGQVA